MLIEIPPKYSVSSVMEFLKGKKERSISQQMILEDFAPFRRKLKTTNYASGNLLDAFILLKSLSDFATLKITKCFKKSK